VAAAEAGAPVQVQAALVLAVLMVLARGVLE